MWLELTRHGTDEAVWVNTDLVAYVLERPPDEGGGSKLFFSGGNDVTVKEQFDRIVERMQLV